MRLRLALLVVLLLAPFAAPVAAQPSGTQPLDRLLPEIRRSLPGRLLDAEPGPNEGGSPSYRLKWLTPDGRVISRDVDARNGRVMGQGPDRLDRRPGLERQDAQRPDGARPNFRPPGFGDNGNEDAPGRFGNRAFGPRRPFDGNDSNAAGEDRQRPFAQDGFNRPSSGDGGRGGFGGRRFGGNGADGRAGNRPVGGGRGRGRGGED